MLLKHLYDFAQSQRLLDDLAFSPKAIRWIIDLDAEGNLIGDGPQVAGDEKRGREYSCPQTIRPKVAGGVSEFLADGLTAVFGLDGNPDAPMTPEKRAARNINNAEKRSDFWAQIEEAYQAVPSPALRALVAFGNSTQASTPVFLRWGPSTVGRLDKSAWWITSAGGSEMRLGPENFTFRANDTLLLEDKSLQEFWRMKHAKEVSEARAGFPTGLCLVTGKKGQKLALTHNPKIQGVPNTQSFGAAIVSFDKPAFGSYGFDQSLNAPTSFEAATAYCVALNHLIGRADHSLRIGATCLCFWTVDTPIANTPFGLLNKPDPRIVRNFVRAPFAGIERDLARRDRFIAVTLAGNAGRIVVRHWLQVPLEEAVGNFHRWFSDLQLDVPERPSRRSGSTSKVKEFHPLSIYWLACSTVREAKDLRADVPAQLYRAALEGTAPSLALIKPMLDQLQFRMLCDENYHLIFDESRFALLRLVLNRNRTNSIMEIAPSLTTDTDDPAYNCGRLLALLATAQDKAHDFKLEGPGIAERYFGTASVSPASVFPLLLRLNRHHLSKIGKSKQFRGHERFIQQEIEAVLVLFKPVEQGRPPSLPRTLDLQAQGRFALGFYQQCAANASARKGAKKESVAPASANES